MNRYGRGLVTLGLCVSLLPSLSACLICTNSTVSYPESRRPMSAALTSRIRIGNTTKQWIIENLGPPTDTVTLNGGVEILHYVATAKRDGTLDVIILGTFRNSRESTETFFVRLQDGIVADFGRRKL